MYFFFSFFSEVLHFKKSALEKMDKSNSKDLVNNELFGESNRNTNSVKTEEINNEIEHEVQAQATSQTNEVFKTENHDETAEDVKDMSIDESSILSDEPMNQSQEIINVISESETTKSEDQDQNAKGELKPENNSTSSDDINKAEGEPQEITNPVLSNVVRKVDTEILIPDTSSTSGSQNTTGFSNVRYDESVYHLKWFDWKGKIFMIRPF